MVLTRLFFIPTPKGQNTMDDDNTYERLYLDSGTKGQVFSDREELYGAGDSEYMRGTYPLVFQKAVEPPQYGLRLVVDNSQDAVSDGSDALYGEGPVRTAEWG